MSSASTPVNDADLHAYVDGELDHTRILVVEAYLAKNPQAAERVRQYQQINRSLHSLFDPVLNVPVPPSMVPPATVNQVTRPYQMLRVAAVTGIMLLSGITGWMLHARLGSGFEVPAMVHLVQPAAFAHLVYATDPRHPVEFGAEKQELLADWLSERMHTDIRAPLLIEQGFSLVGGRLLPSTDRMAAQFMYQDAAGQRITLYMRRAVWNNQESAFQYREEDGLRVFYWIDGPMGYAVSGSIGKERLIKVAESVHAVYRSALNPSRP